MSLRRRRPSRYVGSHRTPKFPPMCDPWAGHPLFPDHYTVRWSL